MLKNTLPKIAQKIPKNGFISISQAAQFLLISPDTLRNWEKQGRIEVLRTKGGSRRYSLAQLKFLKKEISPVRSLNLITVGKASSLLQVSKDTIRAWDKKGIIQSIRTKGGSRRFNRREIIKLQGSLGIDQLATNKISTNVVPSAKNKKEQFRLLGLSYSFGFILLLFFLLLTGSNYLNSLENNFVNESKKILGEKTENLQSQIYEIAGVVENLQKSVSNIQSEPEPEKEYIYIPQTNLEISGLISRDIKPYQTETLNLGSPDSNFKEAHLKNIFGNVLSINNFKLGSIEFLSGSDVPEIDLGSSGDYYFKKSDGSSGLYIKSVSGWDSLSNISSLQSSYEIGNELKTSDNRDINIILSDSVNDSDFSINISGENRFIINDDGSFSDLTPFIVSDTGAVGIGTNIPLSKLHLVSDSSIGSDILRLDSQVLGINNPVFRVDIEGDVFADGTIFAASTTITSGNADIAEEYNVLDGSSEGDLVVPSGGLNLVKSSKSYQSVIGVISTSPGLSLRLKEGTFQNPKPVALAGRVPVKVSLENGSIEPGDYLTSSSVPGVAMKAARPGQVVGKALETFSDTQGRTLSAQDPTLQGEILQGKILVFVNPSFADPEQVLANLIMDKEGNLIIPKIKTTKLLLSVKEMNLQNEVEENPDAINLAASLESLKSDYLSNEIENAKNLAELSKLQSKVEEMEKVLLLASVSNKNTEKSTIGENSSDSVKDLIRIVNVSDSLDLESPEKLLATPSALLGTSKSGVLDDFKVIENLSSEKFLAALDVAISGTLKSLGNVFLGTTTIAGDLTIDGTFSVSQNAINVIGIPTSQGLTLSTQGQTLTRTDGILYLQNSPLAQGLDIFNGKVTIDNAGNLKVQTILVADFRVVSNKITGQGIIKKGEKSVNLENTLTDKTSRILITPTTETYLVLAVTNKVKNKTFTVSVPKIVEEDIYFDWWMINEEEPNEETK